MEKEFKGSTVQPANNLRNEGNENRIVYVMPQDSDYLGADDEIDLRIIWNIVWQGKWSIIGITSIFVVLFGAYALLATEWY